AFNTKDLETGSFFGLLYSETGSYKTTTAANFGGPEKTLILLTRNASQMRPLQNAGFRVGLIQDGESLQWALQFPERAAEHAGFPEWKDLSDRVLVVDDMTEGSEMLVDENRTKDDGSDQKNLMKVYGDTNGVIRDLLTSLRRKKMHVIFTALADVKGSDIDTDETIFPKMPKGARQLITADMDFVFFIKKETKRFLTDMAYIPVMRKDEKTGKQIPGKREIFAKHKISKELVGMTPPFVRLEEELGPANGTGLRDFWNRIQAAKVKK